MRNKWENWIVEGGDYPGLDLDEVEMPDSVLVVDTKTGCMFVGDRLVHSEICMCDKDDQ